MTQDEQSLEYLHALEQFDTATKKAIETADELEKIASFVKDWSRTSVESITGTSSAPLPSAQILDAKRVPTAAAIERAIIDCHMTSTVVHNLWSMLPQVSRRTLPRPPETCL